MMLKPRSKYKCSDSVTVIIVSDHLEKLNQNLIHIHLAAERAPSLVHGAGTTSTIGVR